MQQAEREAAGLDDDDEEGPAGSDEEGEQLFRGSIDLACCRLCLSRLACSCHLHHAPHALVTGCCFWPSPSPCPRRALTTHRGGTGGAA